MYSIKNLITEQHILKKLFVVVSACVYCIIVYCIIIVCACIMTNGS